jgi:hypothetical protein
MTNKEVKAILSEMKKDRLHKRVINEIVQDSANYDGENLQERLLARLGDVTHGLSTGIVSTMVYYSDTIHFFKLYRNEIEKLFSENGLKPQDFRGYDKSDPFIREVNNRNLMAWAAYETIAFDMENALYE